MRVMSIISRRFVAAEDVCSVCYVSTVYMCVMSVISPRFVAADDVCSVCHVCKVYMCVKCTCV